MQWFENGRGAMQWLEVKGEGLCNGLRMGEGLCNGLRMGEGFMQWLEVMG